MKSITFNQAKKWWKNSRSGVVVWTDQNGRRQMSGARLYHLVSTARQIAEKGFKPEIRLSSNGKWYLVTKWEKEIPKCPISEVSACLS